MIKIILTLIYLTFVAILFLGNWIIGAIGLGCLTAFILNSKITDMLYPPGTPREVILGTQPGEPIIKMLAKGFFAYLNFYLIWGIPICLIAGIISIFK